MRSDPAQDRQSQPRTATSAESSSPSRGQEPADGLVNILIVDDDHKNLTVLETVLDDPTYRLVRCSSAEEALLALIVDEFAVLILDISMPGMSGFELAQTIKQRRKTAYVPIIFLTAFYNDDQHVMEGYETGAVDYLHKPVNPVVLRSKVSVFVDLYRKNRDLGRANRALREEVAIRRSVEEELSRLNDTLEQRVAERTSALRKSEERFRQLADSMPQMVWTARRDGSLDYYNARWYEFSNFGPESFGDIANWGPLLHCDDVLRCRENWYKSVEMETPYHVEYRLWNRHMERYCWYLGRALPVRDEEGKVVKWIGTCTDIDDQKRLEEGLRRANQSLEEFAFAASHDLQEPLRNVAVYAELFRQRYGGNLNDEANVFLGIIVEGAQRMGRLVSALLEYTQSASGNEEEQAVRDIDPNAVLERVLENLDQAVTESEAAITSDPLPSVPIQEVHLEQLLQNLIGNALKYRRDDAPPRVRISAAMKDNEWWFAVQDNGIGIAQEYQSKIFGVFKRLHPNGKKYSGTGIGLAICQKIVETYGGRIWVESEPGEGATFLFTLPVKPSLHPGLK